MRFRRIAFVYGVPVGEGGLGVQAGNALRALAAAGAEVHAIGPGRAPGWPDRPNITWHQSPPSITPLLRWTPLRRQAGLAQDIADRRIGRFAAGVIARVEPDCCYAFTQVARETLEWAARRGVPGVLESPNGHIAAFRQVYTSEAARWCGRRYAGHPTARMVTRVEREYATASHVRVSSEWSRRSLVAGGVRPDRVVSLQQPVDLARYQPARLLPAAGPLRACFVGSLDLRKGFVYLLRAARALHGLLAIEFVGGTGDRCCRALLARESQGLAVTVAPGDPRPALARAEVFVLPTLEDGSPFAVAEAMAAGRAVITTFSTGAAEWIRPAESGWVVAPASDAALAEALSTAASARDRLETMGRLARRDTEQRVAAADERVTAWVAGL